QRFIRVLMGQEPADPPPLVEYLIDDAVRREITLHLLDRQWVVPSVNDRASTDAYWENFILFWYRMGYDFVRFETALPFPARRVVGGDPTAAGGRRSWADQHHGMIATWEDLERYPWPEVTDADFYPFEYLSAHLPDGMGLIVSHGAGVFEHLSNILSLEGLCFLLHDDPTLVEAVAQRIGERMLLFYQRVLQFPRVVALFPGDDMGFRTQTLIPPAFLRRFILPWHQRFAQLAHAHGIPYFLHSCGNLAEILEDLIEDVRIDGKHSFEDAILPVWEFQARYGERIAVLGGLDLNVLAGRSPEEVRAATRWLMDRCGARGRYAIGSGNSVPSYVPVPNYLSMVDEANRARGLA
ncbi:MAG: uroporphyrinogen decarboxylase family protein, partial [Armatimonadota bacterium]|nr:uroporphyrinogen decarboxylase family protein [Armatimonadota bacterium]